MRTEGSAPTLFTGTTTKIAFFVAVAGLARAGAITLVARFVRTLGDTGAVAFWAVTTAAARYAVTSAATITANILGVRYLVCHQTR